MAGFGATYCIQLTKFVDVIMQIESKDIIWLQSEWQKWHDKIEPALESMTPEQIIESFRDSIDCYTKEVRHAHFGLYGMAIPDNRKKKSKP